MDNIISFFQDNLILIEGLILILILWNIFLQWQLSRTRKGIKKIFKGRRGKDLEEVIVEQIKRMKNMEGDIKKIFKWNEDLQKIADVSIQKVGVVRFNPFRDTGGDQSFVIALLDKDDNGLVISSLYTREGTRVYRKQIEKAVSSYHLSDEEGKAIQKAMK